jgi:hypothetical protein
MAFNRYAILNLHALPANNLLADPSAPGRLRRIGVGIEHSALRDAAVRRSLGEPDPFRLRFREALREIVQPRMDRKRAIAHKKSWTLARIARPERENFREIAAWQNIWRK